MAIPTTHLAIGLLWIISCEHLEWIQRKVTIAHLAAIDTSPMTNLLQLGKCLVIIITHAPQSSQIYLSSNCHVVATNDSTIVGSTITGFTPSVATDWKLSIEYQKRLFADFVASWEEMQTNYVVIMLFEVWSIIATNFIRYLERLVRVLSMNHFSRQRDNY